MRGYVHWLPHFAKLTGGELALRLSRGNESRCNSLQCTLAASRHELACVPLVQGMAKAGTTVCH